MGIMLCLFCTSNTVCVRARKLDGRLIAKLDKTYKVLFNITEDTRCCQTCAGKHATIAAQFRNEAVVIAAAGAASSDNMLTYVGADLTAMKFDRNAISAMRSCGVVDLSGLMLRAVSGNGGQPAAVPIAAELEIHPSIVQKLIKVQREVDGRMTLADIGDNLDNDEVMELITHGLMVDGAIGAHAAVVDQFAADHDEWVQPRTDSMGGVPKISPQDKKPRRDWLAKTYIPSLHRRANSEDRRIRFSAPMREFILMRYFERCGGCKHKLRGVRFHLDHVGALSCNNLPDQRVINRFPNVQPLCPGCHDNKTRCDGSLSIASIDKQLGVFMAHALGYGAGRSVWCNMIH